MKIENVKNNVENKETYKVRSILLGDGHFLFRLKKKSTSPTWSYFDVENNNGITLIALIITIIIMLILAGVVISLTIGENGIFSTAKYAASETKKKQVQEEIQIAVTDIVTKYIANGNELTNILLKEEIEKYNSLQGIAIDENLVGSYKSYSYYIDETYTVLIGEKVEEKPFEVNIDLKEQDRKITVSVTDAKETIQKVELIAPNGKIIVTKEDLGENATNGNLESIANLSGTYKVKVTSESEKTATKTIAVKKIEITTKEELIKFGEMVNSGVIFEGDTVTLLADIDLGGSASNRNWVEIGNLIGTNYFAGTFEGKGHKISKLYNKNTTEPRQGFFGTIKGGTVQNLGIESGHIKGDRNCGGIAAQIENGIIMNCYNKAKIEGGNTTLWVGNIGGIVGTAWNTQELGTTIKECYNEGEIYGYCDSVGGIAGSCNIGTKINSCYNIGKITTETSDAGGIVGSIAEGKVTINNCYNKGDISGSSLIGGLVGEVRVENEINNGYSTGKVTAKKEMVGGVIGRHSGVLSNLFFIDTAGPAYACGVNNTDNRPEEPSGSTEATLKGLTNKLNGEQNPKPWEADETNLNGGYPILSFQKPPKTDGESEEVSK